MKKLLTVGFFILLTITLAGCDYITSDQCEEISVTFNSNEGTEIDSDTICKDTTILEPSIPLKEGFSFEGWFADSSLNVAYDFSSPVLGNLTLHAKWEAKVEYTISFVENGGGVVENVEYYEGQTIASFVEPELEGHTFLGWYTSVLLTEEFDLIHMPDNDITLYADYEINRYSVQFVDEDGVELATISGDYQSDLIAPVIGDADGRFYWFIDIERTIRLDFNTIPSSDTIIYGKLTVEPSIFVWNIGNDPMSLDPGLTSSASAGDVINNMFEGLVREVDGVVSPGIAESWESSADGLTITFHLRESNWSDGTPLTAHDFERSWKRAMNPDTMSEYSWMWYYTNVVGATDYVNGDGNVEDVGVEATDDYTLVVTLEQPTIYFVSFMAYFHFMPVPESANTLGEGAWAKEPDTAISNGPFILEDYVIGENLILIKNPEYWNADTVNIDFIVGEFISSEVAAFNLYNQVYFDFISGVPYVEIPQLIATNDEFEVFPLLGTYFINFNLSGCEVGGTRDIGTRDNDIFCNANLRNALSLSIDREVITEVMGYGQVPAGGLIPNGFRDFAGNDFFELSRSVSGIDTDDGGYAEAVVLFALAASELGYTVSELQAIMETKEYLYNTSEGHQTVAELMQLMWFENLGFTIQLTNEPWALFQATRYEGNFDLARGGWLSDYMDPTGLLSVFTQGGAYNDCDYHSVAFEEKMLEASTSLDVIMYYDTLYDANEIFMADMPIIPIYHYSDIMMVSSDLQDWDRSVLGPLDFSKAAITN